MSILEIRNLTKNFGGLTAIDGFNMEVHDGEILGLIGPNGAGKTTIFNIISGFLQPTEGQILFRGKDIVGLKPHVIAKMGIVRTFQHEILWKKFTVMDSMRVALNMSCGVRPLEAIINTPSVKLLEKHVDDRALEILRFVGMDKLKDQVTETLSHGYQKTLSLALNVAANPTLSLLDEPLAALNPERANNILDLIKRIRDAGSTIILIEHTLRAIFKICDRIVVIHHGNKIAEGAPYDIKDNPTVISAYLGVKRYVT